jgi:hypothetical protein
MSTFLSLTMAALALLLAVPSPVFVTEVVAGCLVPNQDVEKTDFGWTDASPY